MFAPKSFPFGNDLIFASGSFGRHSDVGVLDFYNCTVVSVWSNIRYNCICRRSICPVVFYLPCVNLFAETYATVKKVVIAIGMG